MTPLSPAGRLPPQDWMGAPATRRVIAALGADGAEVRFVGGCVRDAVLGRPVKDIDLATPLRPEEVLRRLEAAGLRAIPTGLAHGTVTAMADGTPFEITTLRRDVETFGRHARVAFTDDWRADAARRDFTMNALFCAPDGTLYDYFGGLEDLREGRVRFIGDARRRIREDVLRLLRFFRFHAHYGRGAPDPEGLAACAGLAPLLPTLSGERVQAELYRLLQAPDPAAVWRLMRDRGIVEHLLPNATAVDRLAALVALERDLGLAADPVRRLAAVLDADRDAALEAAGRLRLSNADRDRLADLVAPAVRVHPGADGPTRHRWLYRHGASRVVDWALLQAAGAPAGAPQAAALAPLLAEAAAWSPPAFPLKGKDVVALGVPPGPRVGTLLRDLETWWEASDFRPDRSACLAELNRRIAAEGQGPPATATSPPAEGT